MGGRGANRWPVVAAFTALGATTQLLWLTYAPVTDDAARRFGVSETAVGWLANVFPLWYVVLAIPAGTLLDRRLRSGIVLGAVLTAAGALVRLGGDGYLAALAGQTLVAWAQPLVLNAITGVAQRYLQPADRPKGIALASAGTFAGMIAAFALATAVSLDAALAIGAVVAVLVAAAMVASLRGPSTVPSTRETSTATIRQVWRDPLVRRVCALVFVPFGVFTAVTTWAETLLKPAGVDSDHAGLLLFVTIVCGVAGSAVLPVWAARRHAETRVMAAALAITVAASLSMAMAPGFGLGLVAFGVFGFVLLATLPIVLEIVGRAAGDAEGTASGLVWLSGQLGALVITGGIGVIVHHPALSFVALAVATALAAVPLTALRTQLTDRPDAALVTAPPG